MLRITASSDIELVVSSDKLEGAFASPRECSYNFCHPKVSISPHGKYVATLDFLGAVDVFKLDVEGRSLSLLPFGTKKLSAEANRIAAEKKTSFDVVDITWWADHILILANLSGHIFMYDILNCVKVSENDPIFCMPLVENVKRSQEFAFLLENSSTAYSVSITAPVGHRRPQVENGTFENSDKRDTSARFWSLMSFSGRSVSEMYTSLIKNQNYQAALEFASKHNLDADEVFKAQWLGSQQGIHEIKLYLSQINDLTFALSECVTRVGTTEENVQALLSHGLRISDQYDFSNSNISTFSSIWNIRMLRLQLLHFRDRLETFLGINMGR